MGGPCGEQRDITPRTTAHRRAQESAEDGFCLARTADREAIRYWGIPVTVDSPEVTVAQELQSLTRNVPSIFIIEPDTLMVYPISLDAEWDAGSSPQLFCRGNGDGMYAKETRGNAGSPSGDLLAFVFN
jgi:hypothetical protein